MRKSRLPALASAALLALALSSGCDWLFGSKVAVTFHPNAIDASGSMSTRSVDPGEALALPACAFSRPGYGFVGWSLTPTAPVAYADRDVLVASGDLDLYARWGEERSFADSFASLSDPWVAQTGTWAAPSGSLVNPGGGDGLVWLNAGPTGFFDLSVSVSLVDPGDDPDNAIALWFCAADPSSEDVDDSGYLVALFRNTGAAAYGVDSVGTFSSLASLASSAPWTGPKTLRVRRSFGHVAVWIDGALAFSFESPDWPDGYLGFRAIRLDGTTIGVNDATWSLDDFTLSWLAPPD
jgi:uncharacterized repeat protein (TIGR02543 family)